MAAQPSEPETCGNCFNWRRATEGLVGGNCHVEPPKLMAAYPASGEQRVIVTSGWAECKEDEWCSEWEKITP